MEKMTENFDFKPKMYGNFDFFGFHVSTDGLREFGYLKISTKAVAHGDVTC